MSRFYHFNLWRLGMARGTRGTTSSFLPLTCCTFLTNAWCWAHPTHPARPAALTLHNAHHSRSTNKHAPSSQALSPGFCVVNLGGICACFWHYHRLRRGMFACSALVTALYYGPRPDFGDFDTATNPTIPLQHVDQLSCTVETQFWVILSCAGSASLWILVALFSSVLIVLVSRHALPKPVSTTDIPSHAQSS